MELKMGRPRKDASEKKKDHYLSFTDAEWLALQAEAKTAGLSVGRLLADRHAVPFVPPHLALYRLDVLDRVGRELGRIADAIAQRRLKGAAPLLLLILSVAQQIADLDAGPEPEC